MLNIKEELAVLRKRIEDARSELYLMRMTPLDSRKKSFPSDKRNQKSIIRYARIEITKLIKSINNNKNSEDK